PPAGPEERERRAGRDGREERMGGVSGFLVILLPPLAHLRGFRLSPRPRLPALQGTGNERQTGLNQRQEWTSHAASGIGARSSLE
ncbi:hypothetical protein, partial [Acetobacter peroxydans]|uniref:hypothetical protein n=1 Tax=Acetobacter peroxydans TaxID=104098 RepID=UPI002230B0CA